MLTFESLSINSEGTKALKKLSNEIKADFYMPLLGVLIFAAYSTYRAFYDENMPPLPYTLVILFILSLSISLKGIFSAISSIGRYQQIVTQVIPDGESIHLCTNKLYLVKDRKLFNSGKVRHKNVLENLTYRECYNSEYGNVIEFLDQENRVEYLVVLRYFKPA